MAKSSDLRGAILARAERGVAPAAPVSGLESGSAPGEPRRQANRRGKVSICAFFDPAVRRQLRRLALDTDTTAQALMGEALNDLFAKHGLPELVEPD